MAVEESGKGIALETKGQSEITPKVEDVTPDPASTVSPKEEEKIYSQKQLDDLTHMQNSEAGRQRKAIEDERDQFKTKSESLETDVSDIQAERDKLQNDINELSSDDPKKFDLIKRDKELRDAQRTLKKATDDLASNEKANAERVKVANDTLLEISIWEIATEYQTGDPVKLKNLCSTFGATSEEQIRQVADTLWVKETKPAKEGTPEGKTKLVLDTGKSRGGGLLTEEDRLAARYPTMAKK